MKPFFAVVLALLATSAAAQTYPSRPITIIAPTTAGVPGLQMPFWHGIWAPKGTPPDVVAKLNAAVTHALADPAVRARLTQMGQQIYPREQQTQQALAAHHKAEVAKWGAVIKATGVKAE